MRSPQRHAFIVLVAVACACCAAVHAEPLNLARFARVTASDTNDTFLGLWPRETDDAPYTVRDGDLDTGWKAPPRGTSTLTIDLAPLAPRPPKIQALIVRWETAVPPRARVRFSDVCGGRTVYRAEWNAPNGALIVDEPVRAYCVQLVLFDPGRVSLAEIDLRAAPVAGPPAIGPVEVAALPDGLRLFWPRPGPDVHHVRIHYVADRAEPPSGANRVAEAAPDSPWEGPRPVGSGVFAACVPVAEDGTEGEAQYLALPARETPIAADSGVVEGFYGRPWSDVERRDVLVRMARVGLGTYIYGPKDDPLHRDEWRAPYAAEWVERAAELRAMAERLGVTFSIGISPGRDMDTGDQDERAALREKLAPFIDSGFRHVTLLMDDINGDLGVPIDGALGARHTALVNWLKNAMDELAGEPVAVWFVPTVYATIIQTGVEDGDAYLEAMAGLHPDVQYMWTGTHVFSKSLAPADLADVTARVGRKPVIWDNEHATDGGDGLFGNVYLAPYTGRADDLPSAVAGIVANPSILGSANRLMLASYGDYLADPVGYDESASMVRSASLETTDEGSRTLAVELAATFYGSGVYGIRGISPPHNPRMDGAIDAACAAVDGGSREEIARAVSLLLDAAARMATMRDRMHHSQLAPALVDDLWFPADRLTDEGYALLAFVDFIGSALAGSPDPDAFARGEDLLDYALLNDRYQVSPLKGFSLQWALERNEIAAADFVAPVLVEPPADVVFGDLWTYAPTTGATVAVFGLPGSDVDESGVVRWAPPHPGRYHAIVTAETEAGWAWRDVYVTVGLPADESDPTGEDEAEGGDDGNDGCGS